MTTPPRVRIGQGYDVHPLVEGRRLVIGGVEIPHPTGLLGHSDADVLSHAITDALLGAACLGDIGRHFPDTDSKFKDADSLELLRNVVGKLETEGWKIGNIDATVIAEAPKLAPHIEMMRNRLATSLEIEINSINIKATTSEKLGFVGRGDGIAAMAVALIFSA